MKSVGATSAVIYTVCSLVMAGLFVLAATLLDAAVPLGRYSWFERGAGAVWVFILSMIILMPVITPLVKKKKQEGQGPS